MDTVKKSSIVLPSYTLPEEIANSIVHGIGVLLAIAGLVLLSLRASGFLGGQGASGLDIAAVIIFTATMIAMFLISTLYHAVQHQEAKQLLRKLDHSVIFIFIAGTYTPLCLSGLGGVWGWSLFAFQWSMALLGILRNILNFKGMRKIEIAIYLMMGWSIVAGFVPLLRSVPVQSIILLFAGGITYTLGIFVYRKKNIRFTHSVWHFFVLIGAICHWFTVWYLI